jgi:hypothetical protein
MSPLPVEPLGAAAGAQAANAMAALLAAVSCRNLRRETTRTAGSPARSCCSIMVFSFILIDNHRYHEADRLIDDRLIDDLSDGTALP